MAQRDLVELSAQVEQALVDGVSLNLHAQAHARAILSELESPPAEWPQFSAGLDERLYFSANHLICSGLELLEGAGHEDLSFRALTRGAEALEFLATASGDPRFAAPSEILKAAVAYHIADHHARAYVLVERVRQRGELGDWLSQMLVFLLDRNPLQLRRITLSVFDSAETNDASLAARLVTGEFDETDAVVNLGERSLAEAVSLYLEYLKTGQNALLEAALEILAKVTRLAREAHIVDLWWWANALRYLLREFGGSSLWTGLHNFSPDGSGAGKIWRYIRGCLVRTPAITSLWPSQRPALGWITREDRPSFCVRMPTSAGKTRIAELAILKALIDGQAELEAKCVYIAPFRSLAVEIERTLKRGLGPLGVRVSEIYGGFELSKAERQIVVETHVLVATPEKLDAIIRQAPELVSGVKLFVIDEGHLAGDVSNRGIRAEFLLNRLLNKYPREQCRYVFLSGVLPNPEDFARWIGGDQQNLISTDWRPSRLMVGTCKWNGQRVRLDYTHERQTKFQQTCFVPTFIRTRQCQGVVQGWRRRNPFPEDDTEAFAVAAIHFALQGTTLAFIPQARNVESTGRHILAALENERRLDLAAGIEHRWKHAETHEAWDKSRAAITEELGADSDVLKFLNEGFVVHHARLPTRVRLSFESLIRTGEVRLIIATTTLSSGVNLPIRTVLVRGLQQGQNREVSGLEFWNIAGRAGRALSENEGQILFFVDETKAAWQVERITNQIKSIIETTSHASVLGALLFVLRRIYGIWRSIPNAPDLAHFCLKLAEDDFDWAGENRPTVHGMLQIVDQHLLALTSEGGLDNDAIDRLQELLRQSLLFTRLGVSAVDGMDQAAALGVLHSRLRSIHRRIPNHERRGAFYRLGFSIDDCHLVEAQEEALLAKYRTADAWGEWDQNTRIAFLRDLADLALKLDTIRGATSEQLPENFGDILIAWLGGSRSIDIAQSLAVDASHMAKVIESFCVYSLPWAANSFFGHLNPTAEASGAPLPTVCSFFSSMFKFGLCDPLAALFAPYLDGSRTLAVVAAGVVPYSIHQADRALAWLHEVTAVELHELGLSPAVADGVVRSRRATFGLDGLEDPFGEVDRFRFTFPQSATLTLNPGERILLKADGVHPTHSFTLYTARGRKLGAYQLANNVPIWWHMEDQSDAEVEETSRDEAQNLSAIVTVRRV